MSAIIYATVRRNGEWKAKIHIGRPGRVDIDKRFEIIAVVNPKKKLSVGMILSFWPDAEDRVFASHSLQAR